MKVRCIFCKSKDTYQAADGTTVCRGCKAHFGDPNEGGDYSDYNPAARLMREERAARRPPQKGRRLP